MLRYCLSSLLWLFVVVVDVHGGYSVLVLLRAFVIVVVALVPVFIAVVVCVCC